MIELSDETILQDIADFKKRIQKAKGQLSELPTAAAAGTWQTRKELQKRRVLEAEVEHVKKLISIAQEALAD